MYVTMLYYIISYNNTLHYTMVCYTTLVRRAVVEPRVKLVDDVPEVLDNLFFNLICYHFLFGVLTSALYSIDLLIYCHYISRSLNIYLCIFLSF